MLAVAYNKGKEAAEDGDRLGNNSRDSPKADSKANPRTNCN